MRKKIAHLQGAKSSQNAGRACGKYASKPQELQGFKKTVMHLANQDV